MMNFLVPNEDDEQPVKMAKIMTTGKVLFNVVHSGGEMLYSYSHLCKHPNHAT